MTNRTFSRTFGRGHRAAAAVVLCLLGLCMAVALPPARRGQEPRRVDPERVYLLHADVLHFDRYRNPDAQILNGDVAFRHQGATLYCDSAHFYESSNSFEAFGNVKMYQGDTVSLFSDYAFYDGNEMMAEARFNVVLKHRQSTLYTDSLNFDRLYNVGYFFEGGRLVDGNSELTSDWGEYYTETKQAVFNYDVRLRDDQFYLTSDTLYYDTQTSVAHATGPSDITSGTSHIHTIDGYYDTKSGLARLFRRSVLDDGGKQLVGDSVFYDDNTGWSEAFGNVVYTDTLNRNMMKCDYYQYNDSTGYGMATRKAVAIDFSQGDSLYVHADTFKIFTHDINTDSAYRTVHAYHKVRAYRTDVQAVCDSLVYNSADSCLTMFRDPIAWNNNQQLLGEVIKAYMRDSTIDRVHVIGQALSVEQMPDSVNYNQVSSDEMLAFFAGGEIREADANDNVCVVYYPVDESDSSLIGLNYTETTQLKVFFAGRKMQKVWMPKASGTLYPMSQIPPEKRFLPQYAWFDYVRPLDKDDIFNWRGKKAGTELKVVKRKEAPLQRLSSFNSAAGDAPAGPDPAAGVQPDTVGAAPVLADTLAADPAAAAPGGQLQDVPQQAGAGDADAARGAGGTGAPVPPDGGGKPGGDAAPGVGAANKGVEEAG